MADAGSMQQLEKAQKETSNLREKLHRQSTSSPASSSRRSLGGAADVGLREQVSERNLLLSNVLSQLERIMPTLVRSYHSLVEVRVS